MWLRIWSSITYVDIICKIWFTRGDAFCIFDIFKAIRSYELPLHTHSVRMLKRSFLVPKSKKYASGETYPTQRTNNDLNLRAPDPQIIQLSRSPWGILLVAVTQYPSVGILKLLQLSQQCQKDHKCASKTVTVLFIIICISAVGGILKQHEDVTGSVCVRNNVCVCDY